MVDIRIRLLALNVPAVQDLKDWCLGLSDENQEQAFLNRGFGQVVVRDLMLVFSAPATPNGNPVCVSPRAELPLKAPGHAEQGSIVRLTLLSLQLAPPNSKAAWISEPTESTRSRQYGPNTRMYRLVDPHRFGSVHPSCAVDATKASLNCRHIAHLGVYSTLPDKGGSIYHHAIGPLPDGKAKENRHCDLPEVSCMPVGQQRPYPRLSRSSFQEGGCSQKRIEGSQAPWGSL